MDVAENLAKISFVMNTEYHFLVWFVGSAL